MAKRFALAALLLAAGACQSATMDPVLRKYLTGFEAAPGGGWTRVGTGHTAGIANRTYGTALSAGRLVVTDAVSVAARGGPLAVNALYKVAIGDAAAVAARCLAGGPVAALCAAGGAAALAYASYRVYQDHGPAGDFAGDFGGGGASGEWNLRADPGQTTQTVTLWRSNSYPTQCPGSATKLELHHCEADVRTAQIAGSNPSHVVYRLTNAQMMALGAGNAGDDAIGVCSRANGQPPQSPWNGGGACTIVSVFNGGTSFQGTQCPAVIDPFDPSLSRAAGSVQPGPDGKCPTARHNAAGGRIHPTVSATGAGAIVSAFPPTNGATWGPALEEAIKAGLEAPATLETTGPASQTGTPASSTTVANGNTTVTTVTPQYNYTYAPTSITYTTGDVTTTTVNGVTTSTTTTNAPLPSPVQDPNDPCTLNPNRAGCAELGTAPEDSPTWTERSVEYAPADVGPAGSCPAPYDMVIRGWTLRLNYQPACDVAPIIRLGILALAALGAAMTIITTVNK